MTPRLIPIASIDAGDRLRTLDPAWVSLLAEEIALDGLLEPIRVVARGDRFRLVDGARRVAGRLLLDRIEILAAVADQAAYAEDAAVRLGEIKGHLLRGELTALDRAVTVAAWCDLFRDANGAPKRGPKPKFAVIEGGSDEALDELSATMALNWTEAAQRTLQVSRRDVFRSLKIARIDTTLRSRVALHPVAGMQRELLLLADQTPIRQTALVDILTAAEPKAATVAEAIAIFDAVPLAKPVAAHERFAERFSRLDRSDQERFFDLKRDAIDEWLAKRTMKRAS